jgi:hypothetical protein
MPALSLRDAFGYRLWLTRSQAKTSRCKRAHRAKSTKHIGVKFVAENVSKRINIKFCHCRARAKLSSSETPMTPPTLVKKKKPIHGILSVVLPLCGVLVLLGALWLMPTNHGFESNAANAVMLLLIVSFPIGGLVFGLLGLVRQEQPALLSLLGIVLSFGFFLAFHA